MKQLITLIAILFSVTANAQLSRRFSIDNFVITRTVTTPDTSFVEQSDTATQAALFISANDKDSAVVSYALYKADSASLIRFGQKTVSNTAAAVLLVFPINLTNLNNFIMGQIHMTALSEY